MVLGLTPEQWFTYVTLGVTLAHKLVDVARWFSAQTKTDADDKAVGAVDAVLAKVDQILSYMPALRQKVTK